MNVTCAKCQKTYALPDAAFVAGVHIRVRCKGCQNIFEVTQAAAAPASAPAKATGPTVALAEVPESAISDPNKPPGEITRYFIAQSGASKRNPLWKIALFVVLLVGLPYGSLYLLSSLKVVSLNVSRTNERGETVEESFFSAGGVSGLKDLLTGEERRRREAAEAAKKEQEAKVAVARVAAVPAPRPVNLDSPGRMGDPTGAIATGDPNLVGSTDPSGIGSLRRDAVPKLRGVETAPVAGSAGGLDDTAAAKVVAQSQPAFQGCIEEGLRRNPSMKVGKVAVVVLVARSGVVKSASINPKEHENTNWGACLVQRAKRMVFPPFEGDDEAEVQVPLVVGLGI